MLKIIILNIALCLVLSGVSLGAEHHSVECIASTFQSQIGVREKGRNAGPQVEAYLRSTKLRAGQPWCGAFVNWCRVQCKLPVPKNGAWSPSWFPRAKIIWRRTSKENQSPSTGDLFGLYYRNLKRIGHVGFVDKWPSSGSLVRTVEGNTNSGGSREGDGVYRKYRSINQIHCVSRW